MNDGYMGSGKIIRSAIGKYGISNFSKVILETFDNAEAMYAREAKVVTDEFLLREDTYNLRRGGRGGFDHINKDEEFRIQKNRKARKSCNVVLLEKYGENFNQTIGSLGGKAAQTETVKKNRKETRIKLGIKSDSSYMNTQEANEKRKATFSEIGHQVGEQNSQFGTMWITNEIDSMKIKKTDPIPEGWRKGRKLNYTSHDAAGVATSPSN